jgi:hypothetical protein
MDNRQDQARFFSENIDRILAGERPELSPRLEEDLRTALEFTVRIAEMEPRLRPGFEAALQEKLRRQLVELEEKARTRPARNRWSWLRRQLRRQLRQQTWQAVTAAVVLGIAAIIVWVAGVFQPAANVPAILGATAEVSKTHYAAGEQVDIEVSLKNVTAESFIIRKYPPILSVMDSETGQPVYTTEAGQQTMVLAAGEETSFTVYWDQLDADGQPAIPGRYYIELEDLDNQGQPVELDLPRTVSFRID